MPSFFHVLGVLAELPPDDGEKDGYDEHQAAGHQVRNGQEMVLASEPRHCRQHHLLSALEVLHREV